jgi:hypothetical protein
MSRLEPLITECKQIQEGSTYTAEAHFTIEHMLSRKAFWYKIIPAVVTVGGALLTFTGLPNWVNWITLLSGIITIASILLEPDRKARDHLAAAKNFTILKHDARSLHESFKDFMSEEEFYRNVRQLRDRYNGLVQSTPPTSYKGAWDIASARIKSGVHEADFRTQKPADN